jgi:hypothetical protein
MAGGVSLEFGAPLPSKNSGRPKGSGKWYPVVEEFVESEQQSARVMFNGENPLSVVSSLIYTLKECGVYDRIGTTRRGGDVWLIRRGKREYAKREARHGC